MPGEKSKEEFRKSLDSLLDDDFPELIEGDDEDLVEPIRTVTKYANIKGSSVNKAKKTMAALLRFYLSEDIIERNEYVKAKRRIDEASLGTLMYQMETTEKAITTLLEAIDAGEMAPRMFEVLGNLQKTLLDIVKSQTMYLIATEEGMKKMARELDVSSAEVKPGETNKIKSRGTKELMRAIRDVEEEDKVQDVESIEDPDQFDTGLDSDETEL